MLPKSFLDLEIEFAVKASRLDGISIPESLMKYTSLYGMLFIPSRDRNPKHRDWLKFLKYLENKELKQAAHNYYNKSVEKRGIDPKNPYPGKPCFLVSIDGDKSILHFNNYEGAEPGPLSKARISERTKELKSIFTNLKDEHPEVKTVNGYSWLYNLPSYNRLFPREYIDSAKQVFDDFTKLNIWGQFLDSGYGLKMDLVKRFKEKVKLAKNLKSLKESFPYYQLRVVAPVRLFYEFYSI